ncbi:Aminodeoxychorismate synthase [Nakaseomyces bracarensis]|uniref:aminodeoxychorismate synthase n=1 Tax=Nakaseomyces bracarensis TaxID=273131 RepID=A0ABR4NYQ8_9SACH
MSPVNVLFIDSYDSFTYNVVRLIEQQNVDGRDVCVTTIHNDAFAWDFLREHLDLFDSIIVGPGPGNPLHGAKDIGVIADLFLNKTEIPVLGICLGFQSMCMYEGCEIMELDTIKHGQVYEMKLDELNNDTIFANYPETFKSVRYHSLQVSTVSENIIPLAYTNDENGEVLMAAKSKMYPWYGVQYHPESCCSELGEKLIQNFLGIAEEFNVEKGRKVFKDKLLLEKSNREKIEILNHSIDRTSIFSDLTLDLGPKKPQVSIKTFSIEETPNVTFKVSELINEHKFIFASSSLSENRGEWSIIALPDERSPVFTHYINFNKTIIHNWRSPHVKKQDIISVFTKDSKSTEHIKIINEDKNSFWCTLGSFMKNLLVSQYTDLPFIGGLLGILGYEIGNNVENNYVDGNIENNIPRPDAKLVYIENTLLINHKEGKLYLISLNNNFPSTVEDKIKEFVKCKKQHDLNWPSKLPEGLKYEIEMPKLQEYREAFDECQRIMHRGDSYEICLTTQTRITMQTPLTPWRIFQTLVQRNPAPFSSYLEFSDVLDDHDDTLCFISTSPERFLKWDQETCELRPIKGTVKKGPDMDLARATEILKTPKEFGENLMILDLIRNDLYELIPKVAVEGFMAVEEYATVYQLVSVVKAYGIQSPTCPDKEYSGMDMLRHSLPPGSMTGAPKKITVDFLQQSLEKKLNHHVYNGARGIYSGVTGYWSVNGNGDWSVNIRCMYSYNSGSSWQLGAGGAITVLSTADAEQEEMFTKLESALQIFM